MTEYFKDKRILILSPESWGINFVSKHHYASLLAKMGNETYFLNPPGGAKNVEVNKIKANLYSVNYPGFFRGVGRLPRKIKDKLHGITARKILKKIGSPDIVWSFDPYIFQNLSLFGNKTIKIYHPVDVHYTNLEYEVAENADIIFTSADQILKKFEHLDKPKYKINHGLADFFLNSIDSMSSLQGLGRQKVGYVGNLNYSHMNYPTLLQVVRNHPELDFYFIGPYEAGSNLGNDRIYKEEINELQSFDNAFLLGQKPASSLPALINQMDMFLMCYKVGDNIANMANPHKLLEYLSTGKVVVTHYIDEYSNRNELIEVTYTNEEFLARFDEVVNNIEKYNSEDRQEARREFARSNAYPNQLKRIAQRITGHFYHN
ncbi:MAG: hypothetical protein RIB54_20175 [Fulvivirga sp.]|uniref:hypothetical protein n=1 Tax=Fulvivirga sp. TaxID=1931237 RepID=UPI0032EED2BF